MIEQAKERHEKKEVEDQQIMPAKPFQCTYLHRFLCDFHSTFGYDEAARMTLQ